MPRWIPWAAGAAALVLGVTFGAARLLKTRAPDASGSRTAVAVLPFRNLSADSSYAYFAGGLHDELLTQLAKVASLRVIGRTSVLGYEETSKPLRQIGQELAVGSIVEASVQVVGNRLRVAVQLLDPVTQAELWAERYDRTLDDAFAVQSDIARQIVAAVGATVTGTEAGAIAAVPTQNAEAYQFYLRGLEYQRRPGFLRENLVTAQQLYERALALDSSFALAHAASSYVHWMMYRWGYDRSATRLELARREADVALRLAPDLPQAHLAAGVRYQAHAIHRAEVGQFNSAVTSARRWTSSTSPYRARQMTPSYGPRSAGYTAALATTIARSWRSTTRGDSTREMRACWRPLGTLSTTSVATGRPSRRTAIRSPLPRSSSTCDSMWAGATLIGRASWTRSVLISGACRLPGIREVTQGLSGTYACCCYYGSAVRIPCSRSSPSSTQRPTPPQMPPCSVWTGPRGRRASEATPLQLASTSIRFWWLLNVEERAHPEERGRHDLRGFALAGLGRRAEALREVAWLERFDDYSENRFVAGGWTGTEQRFWPD